MLRPIKFTEVTVPGKLFMLEPVLVELPLAGESPWQIHNALAPGQVRKESTPQFLALIQFVAGTGVWKLGEPPEDLEIRVDRNRAVAERAASGEERLV